MNKFERHPYALNYQLLYLIGLDFNNERKTKLRRNSLINCISTLALFIQILVLVTSEMELQRILDTMQTLLPAISFLAFYANLLYNFDTAKEIQILITNHVTRCASQQEVNVIKKYAKQNTTYVIIIVCGFYLYTTMLIFPSLLNLHKYTRGMNNTQLILPIRIEYCLQNKSRYFMMLCLQCFSINIICTLGIAFYSTIIMCLQHLCSLFALVSVRIDQPFKKSTEHGTRPPVTKFREEINWIVSVIEGYNDAIHFFNLLVKMRRNTYCLEVLAGLTLFIMDFLYVFQLLEMTLARLDAIRNSMYIIGNIMMIYCAYYLGQKLIDHSFSVYYKCCEIPFYTLSIQTQKMLMMLMTRTLKPCMMNFNGMLIVSHEIFAKIANVSYTIAIVFYNTR